MNGWSGRRVLILGAARQGVSLARFLSQRGAQVIVSDRKPVEELRDAQEALKDLEGNVVHQIRWLAGGHPLEILDEVDLVCPSGGVPLSLPIIIEAQRRNIPLSNDSQIFLEAAPCRVVGITGSSGKTTTTTLVGRMAQAAEGSQVRHAWIGGNIGTPLISMLDEMAAADLAIMELSSFQLEIMTKSPQIASVLNVTPNHLDRHGSMQAYTAAKRRILDFQSADDIAVLGREDPGAWGLASKVNGRLASFGLSPSGSGEIETYLEASDLRYRTPGASGRLMGREDILLRGQHNLLNVLAASAIALASGLAVEAIRAGIMGFTGVPHRLEFIRQWGGAGWYNDSIATAPERTIAAIRSFEEPLVLLLGGRDKDLPWGDLAAIVQQRVDHLVVFGEAADKIIAAIEAAGTAANRKVLLTMIRCGNLRQAVEAAAKIVKPGDVVLLSPGGTSFDEFADFEERGLCFKQLVTRL